MEEKVPLDFTREVAIRRKEGKTIRQIHAELNKLPGGGIGHGQVGRIAKALKEPGTEQYKLLDWGNLTDIGWQQLPVGIPVEAVPFLLRVGGLNVTEVEAQFCWKVKQAAPDIPTSHARELLRIFRRRFPMEFKGEEVDHSDIWAYLASNRWVGRDEDLGYLSSVVSREVSPLHLTPPNQRNGGQVKSLIRAYFYLQSFILFEIDPFDPRWEELWQDFPADGQPATLQLRLSNLPLVPWDPRTLLTDEDFRRALEKGLPMIEAKIERELAEDNDQPAETERSDTP